MLLRDSGRRIGGGIVDDDDLTPLGPIDSDGVETLNEMPFGAVSHNDVCEARRRS
jgi:hypothetical protein